MDRCRRAHEITRDRRAHDGYKDADQEAEARTHARAVLAELKLLGREQQERVAEAVGRTVKAVLPGPKWAATVYRADGWMRQEARRVGNACVSTGSSRGASDI